MMAIKSSRRLDGIGVLEKSCITFSRTWFLMMHAAFVTEHKRKPLRNRGFGQFSQCYGIRQPFHAAGNRIWLQRIDFKPVDFEDPSFFNREIHQVRINTVCELIFRVAF